MTDREFINNLIKIYFSNAKDPHQATIDNAFTNRLNDIANKLEKQDKVLKIIFEKNVDIDFLKSADTFDEYNKLIKFKSPFAIEITKEEFDTVRKVK